jgi:hypothetical protein
MNYGGCCPAIAVLTPVIVYVSGISVILAALWYGWARHRFHGPSVSCIGAGSSLMCRKKQSWRYPTGRKRGKRSYLGCRLSYLFNYHVICRTRIAAEFRSRPFLHCPFPKAEQEERAEIEKGLFGVSCKENPM